MKAGITHVAAWSYDGGELLDTVLCRSVRPMCGARSKTRSGGFVDRDLSSFFHLLNPNRKNRSAVQNFFRKHPSLRYVWIERATHPTHLETVVNWAITEGKERLAVWGGDGTLSRVVQALYQLGALEKVCLAVIPVGTGNDFTRHLFDSLHWDKLVKRALSSRGLEKRIDVGVVAYGDRKRTFINNAGFGRSSSRRWIANAPAR